MHLKLKCKDLNEINWIPEIEEYLICKKNQYPFLVVPFCKHENTKLPFLKEGRKTIECPKHGWILDLTSGKYVNPKGLTQTPSKYKVFLNKDIIEIRTDYKIKKANILKIPKTKEKLVFKDDLDFKFINHACFLISTPQIKLVTDPWLIGPSFCTGWFLKYKTNLNNIKEILNTKYVFISHSHPDHLNPVTLIWLKSKEWNPTFIIPVFEKKDITKSILESIGFKNFIELKKGEQLNLGGYNDFKIQLIFDNSGRNDSGIIINYKNINILNLVDIPSPEIEDINEIDLALLPFANGASGYPVCWEGNISKEEIINYKKKSNLSEIGLFYDRAKKINPKTVVPFAGYFCTPLPEDAIVNNLNFKNSPDDVISKNNKNNKFKIINPIKGIRFNYKNGQFEQEEEKDNKVFSESKLAIEFRNTLMERYDNFSSEELVDFLKIQDFKSNLLVKFEVGNIHRKKIHWTVYWNFEEGRQIEQEKFHELIKNKKFNDLSILVRRYALGYTIRNSLPWEEFSIGFQALFKRSPNIYNFNFWDYFQNQYNYDFPILGDFNEFYKESSKIKNLIKEYSK